ncbi:class I SAM-dependent methyltransferase [Microvirga tunisiensis]|uniref:Class I SAM-dependent methyltransferase n=1 Tax=Microvirga tunisiensis TaxID=2108360 RepID=A0A5N7MVB2_9HYPH|nr:class I SAM-dependent methyltransferase [Microvirga tunisiensis]MPR12094.1 class I SAM-dependent methyltransferase [Microvirga tunisiensis]MPR30034.1 class I SAM-dependent methyltransferase [Microvirga tunisiensis]
MTNSAAPQSTPISACRSCGSMHLSIVLDLGRQPLANALLTGDELTKPEPVFPLEVVVCEACGLAQVGETIPPAVLFGKDYPYFSSFIPSLVEHSRKHAQELMEEFSLGRNDLVVEVASNDGYLLKNFVEAGIPTLGIDPAAGPGSAAVAAGVPTRTAYFGATIARELAAQGYRPKVMLANNVLAHVSDINDFVAGFAIMVADDGIIEFEFPYVRDLVDRCAFDTIYHEHVFYYSLAALEPLFLRHGLYLVDVMRLEIHGGSLRLRVGKMPVKSERLKALQEEERVAGVGRVTYFRDFACRVERVRRELRDMLGTYRQEGRSIAAYGAAAKGATLLNFLALPEETISFVVDRNAHKVGKYMPGVRLPIRDVSEIRRTQPDYLLILTWNFADEVVEQQRDYRDAGGTFLCPIPTPHVL